ncbi:MAG: 50S ribosomal protein L5 [Patescibacteria group bacterium]|jgi:large subunit ribosomal protein L5
MESTKVKQLNKLAQAKITKVIVNVGIGKIAGEKKTIAQLEKDIATITGQKGVQRASNKSIAGFKLRAGMIVGYMVTLRGKRMNDFLTRLINVALPRIRDFKGLSVKSFDKQGNYNIGIREHVIFPEINYDDIEKNFGFNITICTTAKSVDDAISLLKGLGMPFKEN